jgi:putative FmdB family regulatory protein
MPIYAYRCDNCGVQFERQQSFNDQPLKRCPECNKSSLKKVIAPVGIVFKGSGFYATDHRSPSGGGNSKAAKQDATKESAAKETPKTETSD